MAIDPRRSRQHGLTLVEMIVTIVILGIALAALASLVFQGVRRSSDTLMQTQSVALAQSYIEEILSKRFDENAPPSGIPPCHLGGTPCTAALNLGPEPGESRASFDDVDDYHGLDEGYGSAGSLPLLDMDGLARSGYENFGVTVSVRYLDLGPGGMESLLEGLDDVFDAKLITVTIRHRANPGGWQFSVYKANF